MVQQLRHIQVVKLYKKNQTIGLNRTKYLSPWTSFKVFKNDKFKLYVNFNWINLYHKTQKNLVLLSGLIIYMNSPLQSTSTDHGALTNKLGISPTKIYTWNLVSMWNDQIWQKKNVKSNQFFLNNKHYVHVMR